MNRNTVYFIRSLIAPNGHIEVLKKKDTNSYLSPGERKIKKVLEEFSDGKETDVKTKSCLALIFPGEFRPETSKMNYKPRDWEAI